MGFTPYKFDESHYDDTSRTRHCSDGARSSGKSSDTSFDHHDTSVASSNGSAQKGRKMSAGAAHFHPGHQSHYYRDMRGEWEDDDF
jgi:hypothetical protein